MKENKSGQLIMPFKEKVGLILLGIFLFFVLLETGLRLCGFILLSMQEYRNRQSIKHKGTYRIMCLGESTTAGQWPPFLEETLNQRNIGIKFSIIDKGIPGINTSHILDMLTSNLDTYHPDMVITMMGINDKGPHVPYEPVSNSRVIDFLKSLRIYKLTKLFWLHIVTTLKEVASYKPSNHTSRPQFPLQTTEVKQRYAEETNSPPGEELLKLKKSIERNLGDDAAYTALAYISQGKLSESEELLKKAIELNPRDDVAYTALAWFYQKQGKLSEAEELLKKAIELNRGNYEAYRGLAWLYRELGKPSEADESLKKYIGVNPENIKAYIELAWFCRGQGKLSEAEELLKKSVEFNPGNVGTYTALELLYEAMGKPELAKEYGKKAKEVGLSYYNPIITDNYHKFKTILDKRGIVYVCVQYPMRALEPLKKVFAGQRGIIFVDNEKVFKEALKNAKYEDYFIDMVGGDFGHCTEKGNRLLAENIANVILKEVFHK